VNARELCKLAGVEALTGAEASRATPSSLIVQACTALSQKIFTTAESTTTSNVYVAVTDGPFPAYILSVSTFFICFLGCCI
jgi:hypothetical protein